MRGSVPPLDPVSTGSAFWSLPRITVCSTLIYTTVLTSKGTWDSHYRTSLCVEYPHILRSVNLDTPVFPETPAHPCVSVHPNYQGTLIRQSTLTQ